MQEGSEKIKSGSELKECPEDLSLNNTIFLFEEEFAVTDAQDPRPAMLTGEILGFNETGCIGLLYLDPEKQVAAMGHLFNKERLEDYSRDMIGAIRSKTSTTNRLKGFIVRPQITEALLAQIQKIESENLQSGILESGFQFISERSVVFDTRTSSFLKPTPKLFPGGHPSDRPYGKNRYDPQTGKPRWAKAYP